MGFIKEMKRNKLLYLLALPGLLCIFVFSYIPISGHLLAFKAYTFDGGIFGSPWVGLENFKFFFSGNEWKIITLNTLYLNFMFIVFTQLFAISIAVLINEIRNKYFMRIAQSLIFLPYFVSWLVVSLMLVAMLNNSDGMINGMLASMGLEKYGFYMNPKIWPAILTTSYVWKFAGYYSVIYIAAIIGIPQDYYDSANIDGASRIQQIFFITLPLISKTIMILALLAVGRIFYGDFGMIYGIVGDNGILFPTTDVIDTYVYRALKTVGDFGMASAVSLYQSLLGLITIIIFNTIVKRMDADSALF